MAGRRTPAAFPPWPEAGSGLCLSDVEGRDGVMKEQEPAREKGGRTGEARYATLADRRLAYQQDLCGAPGVAPGALFLGGFGSDMGGTKACFLSDWARKRGRNLTRFDYRGHGLSSGAFEDGTLGDWLDDARFVLETLTEGPQILVGSSMGGWIALLLARAFPERVAGILGVAAAPDFTELLIRPNLTPAQAEALERDGLFYEDGAPEDFRKPVTRRFMEEARKHLVLNAPLRLGAPLHLVQGLDDAEVPWRHALRILETVEGARAARLTLVKAGDHRLSRPDDLALLAQALEAIA